MDLTYCCLAPEQRLVLEKSYTKKMFDYLSGKIYYITSDDEFDGRLNRIVKEIGQVESDRSIFIDVEFVRNSTGIHFNLKLVKFLDEETKEMEADWHSTARMWKFNYNPLKNLKILHSNLEKAFHSLVKLKLLDATDFELEKLYL